MTTFHSTTRGLIIATLLHAAVQADDIDFAKDIRPILSDACYTCHGPDAGARSTELRLDDRASALESNVFSSGEMLRRLQSDDADVRMPPVDSSRVLSDADRTTLVEWLKAGARWPEDDRHWAFVPPVRPDLPAVKNVTWVQNGIDHFVLSRLEQAKLAASKNADRDILLRRVTFDLTGLPPTIEELDAFLADDSGNAYEKVVDRLLASPRYGEHMALDWLEASRYADTDGYQNDRLRYMWVWRDWLISALNDNMPFDRFVIEQMAGDLVADRNFYTQVATGFHRNHRINSEGGSIPEEWIVEYVADRVETTGTVFLGLTMTCCRCHDHKYDPVTQRDFYSMFAFFNNIAEAGLGPNNGNSPPFIPVPGSWPNLSEEEAKFVDPEPVRIKVVQTSVPRPQPGSPETVMVLHELDRPRDTYRLKRGLYDQPDRTEKLSPATPVVLGGWRDSWPRNRLGLAWWLTSPDNPLTARVTMNRMWQHYFGTGLVKTSENFGMQGELPSHPKLLDWLATEFFQSGWDVKAMHKLIVMSATYRQSSVASRKLLQRDPENRLLARGPRRRLSPFAIRDAALFNSGLLVEKIGGPSVKPYMPPGIWKSISNAEYAQDKGEKLYRRSMYTYWRRTVPPPTMMAFNAASRETCIVRSDMTTTPLQALTLLNNVTFVESARFLAERMLARHNEAPAERIRWAFRLVTSREPRPNETALLVQNLLVFLEEFQGDPEAAQKLLATGEKPCNTKLDVSTLAAYTLVANTILNLDEAMSQN
ncbi:MAG: PSD1 and planctomycete cytochrome C domain-containing protein [Fuerstiella sp.]